MNPDDWAPGRGRGRATSRTKKSLVGRERERETPPAPPLTSAWSPGVSRVSPAAAAAAAARAAPRHPGLRSAREEAGATELELAVWAVKRRLRAHPKVAAGLRGRRLEV